MKRLRSEQGGFTLAELLVAITVASAIVLVIGGAFAAAVRASVAATTQLNESADVRLLNTYFAADAAGASSVSRSVYPPGACSVSDLAGATPVALFGWTDSSNVKKNAFYLVTGDSSGKQLIRRFCSAGVKVSDVVVNRFLTVDPSKQPTLVCSPDPQCFGRSGTSGVPAQVALALTERSDYSYRVTAAPRATDVLTTNDGSPTLRSMVHADGTPSPSNAAQIQYRVLFSESVTGVDAGDFYVTPSSATIASVIGVGGGTAYTVVVNTNSIGTTANGTITLTLHNDGTIKDRTGKALSTAGANTDGEVFTIDKIKPTVTVNQRTTAPAQVDPARALPILYTVTFSEPVTGFGASDLTRTGTSTGGTVAVSGSGTSYEIAVTGTPTDGTLGFTVPADAAQDAAGNTNAASTSTDNTVTFDTTAPTVTVNQKVGQADPTNAVPITFTVTFSEAVTGFDASDLTRTGTSTGGTAAVTGSGANYEVAVTGAVTDGTLGFTVGAGKALDAAGNGNLASTSTDNVVTRDTVAPTVTVNQKVGQADPTNAVPITFTVTFSEPVTGFDASDVTRVTGSTGGSVAVTGSGANYEIAITGTPTDGVVGFTIAAGRAFDLAGNANVASTSTDNVVTRETVAPTVTVNQKVGQIDPTNALPITFTVTFSELVTGFDASDLTRTGTSSGGTVAVTGSGTSYEIALTGTPTDGTLGFTVAAGRAFDLAGNGNVASTSTDNTVTFDTTAPTVTVNQKVGQADPTNAVPITFTVTFSEPVTGFDATDLTRMAGSTAGSVAVTGSGANYEIVVTGTPTDGPVGFTIAAGRAVDLTGNANLASTSTDNVVTRDTVPPTVTVNQKVGQADPTNAVPITFTVTFSEPVTGFGTSDVTRIAGSTGGSVAVTGSGANYEIAVTGTPTDGLVGFTVAAGRAFDLAGNANVASTSTDNTVTRDTVAPTVTVNQKVGQADPTNVMPILFTVTFSESVTGFDASDLTRTGTSTGGTVAVTGSGANYEIAVTGTPTDGTLSFTVPAGKAQDAAGNGNVASTSTDNTVTRDTTAPAVTIANPANGSAINDTTPAFSGTAGNATGDSSTVTINIYSGASATGTPVQTGTATRSGTSWARTATALAPNLQYTAVAIQTDSAGNTGTSAPVTFTVDTTAPTVTTVVKATGQIDPTTVLPVNFTVVFSEPVTGFSTAGLTLGGTAPGTKSAVVTGSGTTYNVAVSGATSTGTVTVQVKTGAAQDAAANANTVASAVASVSYVDATAPQLVSLTMFDTNANGKIDQVKAVFDDTLAAYTAGKTPWTLANVPSGGSLASVSVSGSTATLTITEGSGAADTSVGSFTVTLAASGTGIRDAAGNQSSFSARGPADSAGPVATAQLVNGGTIGTADRGDKVVIDVSETINTSTICGDWLDYFSDKTLNGVVVTITNNSSSDLLTVTSSACPLSLGTVDLNANYVSGGSKTFGTTADVSSLKWMASTRQLIVTLGAVSGGTGTLKTGVAASTPIWSQSPAIADPAGNVVAGSGGTSTRF